MKAYQLISIALVAGAASLAQADNSYLGASVGHVTPSRGGFDSTTVRQISIGYRFANSALGIELAHVDFDTIGDNTAGLDIDAYGNQLSLLWNFLAPENPVGVYVKAGVFNMHTNTSSAGGALVCPDHCSIDKMGQAYGVGGSYRIAKQLTLYGEADLFPNVDSVAGNSNLRAMNLGARWNF